MPTAKKPLIVGLSKGTTAYRTFSDRLLLIRSFALDVSIN
jgi:hypothetical protein